MKRSDHDIDLIARLLKGRYGVNAAREAGRRADARRREGNRDRALLWMMVLMSLEQQQWREKRAQVRSRRPGFRAGRFAKSPT